MQHYVNKSDRDNYPIEEMSHESSNADAYNRSQYHNSQHTHYYQHDDYNQRNTNLRMNKEVS